MDTVCVVLATYNGQKFIREQIDSLINQTHKADYIVVSDGMSSDNTVEICHSILETCGIEYKILTSDVRLSVIDNFQKGLENSAGDYIFFCDQDDVWLSEKIQITLEEMKKCGASMGFCNAKLVDVKLQSIGKALWGSIGYKQKETIRVMEPCEEAFMNELIKHNVVTGMCMCIKEEVKEIVLPFSKNALHDTWIAFMLATTRKTVAINKELALYRQHGNNVVGAANGIKKTINNATKYLDYIQCRQSVFEEMVAKLKDILPPIALKNLDYYMQYLEFRIRYMSGKGNFIKCFSNCKSYKKYELNYAYVLLRDIFLHCCNKFSQNC